MRKFDKRLSTIILLENDKAVLITPDGKRVNALKSVKVEVKAEGRYSDVSIELIANVCTSVDQAMELYSKEDIEHKIDGKLLAKVSDSIDRIQSEELNRNQ